MSVHNAERFLAEAIESILAQTFGDFEFLIVNDGSSDRSGKIIEGFARRDVRVRPMHQENQGLITSLNRLIDEARAPLIARMDGDDVALPDRFAKQIEFLDANPNYGVVGTNIREIDELGTFIEYNDLYPLDHASIVGALELRTAISHPTVIMRREVVRAVGGYHPAFRHCEDYDLWLRLSTRTCLGNIPDRLLHYRRSASQVSRQHALSQQTGAAIAWAAHCERMAGRTDPTERLVALPPLDELDALFNRPGTGRAIRAKIVRNVVHSACDMRGEGYALLARHLAGGGTHEGLWRTVARLITYHEPWRAIRLASMLLLHRASKPPLK